jgi:uncharacterized protein (DUF736 family)
MWAGTRAIAWHCLYMNVDMQATNAAAVNAPAATTYRMMNAPEDGKTWSWQLNTGRSYVDLTTCHVTALRQQLYADLHQALYVAKTRGLV